MTLVHSCLFNSFEKCLSYQKSLKTKQTKNSFTAASHSLESQRVSKRTLMTTIIRYGGKRKKREKDEKKKNMLDIIPCLPPLSGEAQFNFSRGNSYKSNISSIRKRTVIKLGNNYLLRPAFAFISQIQHNFLSLSHMSVPS